MNPLCLYGCFYLFMMLACGGFASPHHYARNPRKRLQRQQKNFWEANKINPHALVEPIFTVELASKEGPKKLIKRMFKCFRGGRETVEAGSEPRRLGVETNGSHLYQNAIKPEKAASQHRKENSKCNRQSNSIANQPVSEDSSETEDGDSMLDGIASFQFPALESIPVPATEDNPASRWVQTQNVRKARENWRKELQQNREIEKLFKAERARYSS
ncbi:hypothetical protein PCANC_11717 [Puccinia coronata f. sp. avenae]|uniref:Uncharacterized protein n=1 Tax=Puccinia coronata f. sp. avenae TaxID=200324 RepID=A0A2N5STJ8_9BASI|nr:hypothetical protein PCANC_11717 [Puccinia coronata f. sp. avenae]